jgi:hypothetical protein
MSHGGGFAPPPSHKGFSMNVQVKANKTIIVDGGKKEIRMGAMFNVGEHIPSWDATHILRKHHTKLITIDNRDLPKVEKQYQMDLKKASK